MTDEHKIRILKGFCEIITEELSAACIEPEMTKNGFDQMKNCAADAVEFLVAPIIRKTQELLDTKDSVSEEEPVEAESIEPDGAMTIEEFLDGKKPSDELEFHPDLMDSMRSGLSDSAAGLFDEIMKGTKKAEDPKEATDKLKEDDRSEAVEAILGEPEPAFPPVEEDTEDDIPVLAHSAEATASILYKHTRSNIVQTIDSPITVVSDTASSWLTISFMHDDFHGEIQVHSDENIHLLLTVKGRREKRTVTRGATAVTRTMGYINGLAVNSSAAIESLQGELV